jgi:hypothetical protein
MAALMSRDVALLLEHGDGDAGEANGQLPRDRQPEYSGADNSH